jgi:hypothetical protein
MYLLEKNEKLYVIVSANVIKLWAIFTTLLFLYALLVQQARVSQYTKLVKLGRDKHSSLLHPFISYEKMKCREYGSGYTKILYLFSSALYII